MRERVQQLNNLIFLIFIGGRTRARTLDPLIKRQLFFKSYQSPRCKRNQESIGNVSMGYG
jgi:hypothetical protein